MRSKEFSKTVCRSVGEPTAAVESTVVAELVRDVGSDKSGRFRPIVRRFMPRVGPHSSPLIDAGQATAEYALVMLAAAALAGGVLAWVISSDAVGRLMDAVFDSVISEVSG